MEVRLRRYDEVVLEKLKVLHRDEEKVVGVLYSLAELNSLRDRLLQYNFWFSTRNVEKHYEKKDSIHWVLPKLQGAPPMGVALDDNAPFVIDRVVHKDCRRGKAYWKRKNEKKTTVSDPDDLEPPKKKRKPYPTIKSDCPAKMSIRTIKAFPAFAVCSDTTKKNKGKYARLLRQAILSGQVEGEERYVVAISRAHHHQNHQDEISDDSAPSVHPVVVDFITKLVTEDCITAPKTIKALVFQFSQKQFGFDEVVSGDRHYFPRVNDIRHIIRSIYCNVHNSLREEIKAEHEPLLNNNFCQATHKTNGKVDYIPNERISDCEENADLIDHFPDKIIEQQIFNIADGYLTVHFFEDTPDDNSVATHVVTAADTSFEMQKVLDIQTVSGVPQDSDTVTTDRFKLLTALNLTMQQVTEVTNSQALRDALSLVEKASILLESTLNK